MKETLLHVPQDYPEKAELIQKAWGLNRVESIHKPEASLLHGPPQDLEGSAET